MKRRWPSAKTTSNANDDLPEPLGPVTTVRAPCGMEHEMLLRLCSRACSTPMATGGVDVEGEVEVRGEVEVERLRRATPVLESSRAMAGGGPVATRRPPCGPPPGPRSSTQ